jgi:hypothetical protein
MNYFICSVPRTQSCDEIVWWKANGSGYTTVLEKAGRYSENELKTIPAQCLNVPIPCDVVEVQAVRVVPRDSIDILTGKTFLQMVKESGQ